jgi:hypothetical protein
VDIDGIPAEWIYTPDADVERVVLYLHGGAYIIGSLKSHRDLVARLSSAAGVRGLQIDYHLAPEQVFPAALDDALTALTQNQLSYLVRPDLFQAEEGMIHLVLETGILLYFDVGENVQHGPAGLQLLNFPDMMKHLYDEAGNALPRSKPKGGTHR